MLFALHGSCKECGDQQEPLTGKTIPRPAKYAKIRGLPSGYITIWMEIRWYGCRFLRSQNCRSVTCPGVWGTPCGLDHSLFIQMGFSLFLLHYNCSQRNDLPARLHVQAHLKVVCDPVTEFLQIKHKQDDVCHSVSGPSNRWDSTTKPSAFYLLKLDEAMPWHNCPHDNRALGNSETGT